MTDQTTSAAATSEGEANVAAAEQHGRETTYLAGCRCPYCRNAHRIGRGRRQLRLLRDGPALLDPTGTRRRLQALAAIGYSVEDIATGIGTRPSYVGQLQHTTRRVHRRTAENVCHFYNTHADYRGPSPRAIHYAARNGWLSPIWWDDDTIDDPTYTPPFRDRASKGDIDSVKVDRIISGDQLHLNRAEKLEAFHRLRVAGHSVTAACQQLGLSGSTGRRYESLRGFGNPPSQAHDRRMDGAA